MTGRPQDDSGSEQLPDELVWIDTGRDDDVDDSLWDDTEDDYEEAEEDVDVRAALGLPEVMPALRLPPVAELARAARDSALLASARKLAVWTGDGKAMTEEVYLVPAEVAAAADLLGIEVAPGVTDMTDVPELAQAWNLALCSGLVHEDEDGLAVAGEAVELWPDGTDDDVLEVWSRALEHVAGHSLGDDDPDQDFDDLHLNAVAAGLVVTLFLAREDGLPLSDCREMVRDSATADLRGSDVRKRWDEWVRQHGEVADVVLERTARHGAVSLDGDTARLTPLGLWRMREDLAGVTEVPLLPDPADMTAADLVSFAAEATESELDRESRSWLATRSGADAARELLAVATAGGCTERLGAYDVASRIGAESEQAWREHLGDQALRPYAKLALNHLAERDPATDPLPGLGIEPEDAVGLLGDMVATMEEDMDGDALAAMLRQSVPAGQEVQIIELMASSGHPAAEPTLTAIGRHHPDKKIAKAARKAAFKARAHN
ncbi:MAG TPA: hypothetical protein VGH27_11550 [Streptosporangiaceae bacterium]|jgi:hypothetical protein